MMGLVVKNTIASALVVFCLYTVFFINRYYVDSMSKGLYAVTYNVENNDYVAAKVSLYIPLSFNRTNSADGTDSKFTEVHCCPGYRLMNDTCYWAGAPKANYERALKKWNRAHLIQQFQGRYDNCPSFLFEVDYKAFYSEEQFWGLIAIILFTFLLMMFAFACMNVFLKNNETAAMFSFILPGVMSVMSISTFSIFVPIVVIPIDYVWISMGNPFPTITMIFAMIIMTIITIQVAYNFTQFHTITEKTKETLESKETSGGSELQIAEV